MRHSGNALVAAERQVLAPVIKGRNVRRYALSHDEFLLLFPYAKKDGEFQILSENEFKHYSKAYAHLSAHRSRLVDRIWFGKTAKELSGQWF